MTSLAQARAKCSAHNGRNRIVREELERAGVPLTVYKLQLATGFKAEQIRAALTALMQVGGVVSFRGAKNIGFYEIYRAPKAKTAKSDIAGPITIGRGSRWFAGLV